MTILLTLDQKKAESDTLAAQLAEYQANGGRVLQVTKDTVINPQPKSNWITPATAKPQQVVLPKAPPKPKPPTQPKQPKPPAKKRVRKWIPRPPVESPNAKLGKQRRANILEYMRNAGTTVTLAQIAEHLNLNIHGGFRDQIDQLIKAGQIQISHKVGKLHFYEVMI